MNQWTKVAKIMNWVNNYAKEYKDYSFWYMNNHELKFSIGDYVYIISYNDKYAEIVLQIYNNRQEWIYSYFAYITLHYSLTLGPVIWGIIDAFIVGLNTERCNIRRNKE